MAKKVFCLFSILLFLAAGAFCQETNSSLQEGILLAKAEKSSSKKAKKESKKKSKKNDSQPEEEIQGEVTAISVDKNRGESAGYFSGIGKHYLELVENGSAESLIQAYNGLKKAGVDYAENERVLVFIIVQILKIVWPSQIQGLSLEEPEVPQRNVYTGAIDSAKNGIFDTSTGNKDFLGTLLPALVLSSPISNDSCYEDAEASLRAALSMRPKSVLANYLLALLYSKTARVAAAVDSLKVAAQESKAFEILFCLANNLNALGRYDESKSVTDSLIVIYPSSIDLLKLLARNSYDIADYASAERYAVLVLQQNPSDLEMLLFRAKIFVTTGEYLKATSLLDVYSRTNSTAKDYLLLRSRVQKEWNKNSPLAISTIEKALSLYPDDKEVILAAAALAGESGSLIGGKDGAQLANMVLAVEPENPQALSFLIQTLVSEEKWAESYTASKKVMSLPNPGLDAILTHVRVCLSLGYNNEAWDAASALYNRLPNEEKAVQIYVESMVRTGRVSQASKFINTSINGASSSMKSFLYYQRSFLASGEAAQLADLRSAVIANPRNSDALFRMYGIYFAKQDYRKAQYYLRQVIALNPNKQRYLKLNSELDKLIR